MDLRQRRKVETTELIQRGAIELARARGVAAVTIEAICEAAGISQRTFFNYFPYKEAVFLLPPPPLPAAAVERFVTGTGDIVEDLSELLVAQITEMERSSHMGAIMREIAETHPRLMPLQMAEFQKFEAELQRLIAGRLGTDPEDVRAMVLAQAMIGVTRATIDRSVGQQDYGLPQKLREGFAALVNIFRGSA